MCLRTTYALHSAVVNPSNGIPTTEPVLDRAFLGEIEAALGVQRQIFMKQIEEIQQALRPMFASMQVKESDKLGMGAVHYVLHRLFMQIGWSVRGLEAAGDTLNTGSPTEILKGHVPDIVRSLFDEQLDDQGLGFYEVAIFAATVKHVVHNEMKERLRAAYRANNIQTLSKLEHEQGQQILDVYMSTVIFGDKISAMNISEVSLLVQSMNRTYPLWVEIRKQVQDLQQNVTGKGVLEFSKMKRVVEEVGDRFAFWNNAKCLKQKRELVAIEEHDSGRVRLSEFYRISQFEAGNYSDENTEYLQHLGVLDDTDPNDLHVIIPNWINSIPNCMAPSNHYSICCLNECDALIAKIESEMRGPFATPTEIAPFIAALPSDTVPGNRTLPASLLRRLSGIAGKHDGLVPIHGTEFALWMNRAYPRECPVPHASGTKKPKRTQNLETLIGSECIATTEQMMCPRRPHSSDEYKKCAPWMEDKKCAQWMEEESLLEQGSHSTQTSMSEHGRMEIAWGAFYYVAILFALASGFVGFAKLCRLCIGMCTRVIMRWVDDVGRMPPTQPQFADKHLSGLHGMADRVKPPVYYL